MQTNDADPRPSTMAEEELLALKTEYLAAHSSYQTYLTLCATAELGNSGSWRELLAELEQALEHLERARSAYRCALFKIAFGSDTSLN